MRFEVVVEFFGFWVVYVGFDVCCLFGSVWEFDFDVEGCIGEGEGFFGLVEWVVVFEFYLIVGLVDDE